MKSAWIMIATEAVSGGCGKAQEAASEKVVEKAIEAAAAKDGTNAKVDLADGAMKMTTTDAQGKTTRKQIGGAKVTEADLGVSFYPGAKATEGSGTRVSTNDGSSARMALHSADASDKVATFYRGQLQAKAAGRQLMDMASDGDATLALVDQASNQTVQVHVTKAESGSDILITTTRKAGK